MNESKLRKLFKAAAGEMLSEDNDTDVTWLVFNDFLNWNDDEQRHEVTVKGRDTIRWAVESVR